MAVAFKPGQVLELAATLEQLVAAGLVRRADANLLAGSPRSREQALKHPLAYIAGQQLANAARPGRLSRPTRPMW